ncbi:MAG: hypothetical protein ACRBN8_34045 [Nannocystales bacterium]
MRQLFLVPFIVCACGEASSAACVRSEGELPEAVAERSLGRALVNRSAPGPFGDFYAVGLEFPEDEANGDMTLWKLAPGGEALWKARWGTYSSGGVVQWTWEDVGGLRPSSNLLRPKMLVPDGENLLLVAKVDDDETLHGVSLSSAGEMLGSWDYAIEGRVMAAHVDEIGDVWVALDQHSPWLGQWRADGTFVEAFEFDDGPGAPRAAAFGPDGSLAIAGSRENPAGDDLVVMRFDARLENPRVETYGTDVRGWSRALDIAVDCSAVAWITSRASEARFPLQGFDRDAKRLWTVPGLSTIAVGETGDALTAGFDPAAGEMVVIGLQSSS